MKKNYARPAKVQKKEAPKAPVVHRVDGLSPKEYTLQRRIDSYLRAKKEKTVRSFDTGSLKKDLQQMINSYGNAVDNKKRNPLEKKLGYYYAIMMDIEGKAKRPVNKARTLAGKKK
ncbi:MAG: hypothetical protein ACYC69_03095 [Thermodesulfovibrionales bacterium]